MRVRQQDIARLAKVSQATVSRVLSGDAKVDQKISERVRAVMRSHNYQPDVRARSLRSKRTGLIGLVIKRPHGGLNSDPFFANLISEIIDFLETEPYHLCLDSASNRDAQVSLYDEMLRSRRVDGLILVESEARDERIQRLQDDAFPFVLIGNPGDKGRIWSVDNDNVAAAESATRHLLEQGYQRIGMMAGPEGITVSEDRMLGYQRALAKSGQSVQIWNTHFGFEAARECAREVLRSSNAPDALLVLDDFMAMGAVQAARETGRTIPNELGLVSFNDSPFCGLLECGLTSVNLNIGTIVRIACEQLIEAINCEEGLYPTRQIVPSSLIVRGSSTR